MLNYAYDVLISTTQVQLMAKGYDPPNRHSARPRECARVVIRRSHPTVWSRCRPVVDRLSCI
jgi:hypothetical protein